MDLIACRRSYVFCCLGALCSDWCCCLTLFWICHSLSLMFEGSCCQYVLVFFWLLSRIVSENVQSSHQSNLNAQVEKHEFMVKPDFDPELQRLRKRMDEVEKVMHAALIRAASELDLEAGKTIKVWSYYLWLRVQRQMSHQICIVCAHLIMHIP